MDRWMMDEWVDDETNEAGMEGWKRALVGEV